MKTDNFTKIQNKLEEIDNMMGTYSKKSFIIGLVSYLPLLLIFSEVDKKTGDMLMIIPATLMFFIPIILLMFGGVLGFTSKEVAKLSSMYRDYYKDSYHKDSENEDSNDSTININIDNQYDNYLRYMNLEKDTTKADIKKAYRKLAKLYHPDKVAMQGKDKIREAINKMQKINEAYEYLMRY